MQKEPLVTIGAIGSLIGAVIVLLQTFGVPITDAQSQAINNLVVIAAPILVALIGRQFVFAPATVDKIVTGEESSPAPKPSREAMVTDAINQLERASKPKGGVRRQA